MKRWIVIGIFVALCLGLFFILAGTSNKLELIRANLASTETELASAQTELASTQTELTSTQTEFTSMQTELTLTQTELTSTQTELTSTQTEPEGVQDKLTNIEVELADLQTSYDGLITGHGYTIKDPTYKQMMSFIREDKTDKKQYIEGEYVCANFAMDVCNYAEEKGIRCAYINLWYPGEVNHAIVAFNTIDKGLTYIEPQTDEVVKAEIGKHFYKCVVPKPGYYYEKPDYDDTIEKILVIW